MGGAFLIHHLPREIIRTIYVTDFYDGIAVASIAFPWGIMDEHNFLYARLVKHKISGSTGMFNERFIPKNLSS
jgi:hypothetical protein